MGYFQVCQFVQLLSGNHALNKAISFDRSHISQPRSKTGSSLRSLSGDERADTSAARRLSYDDCVK